MINSIYFSPNLKIKSIKPSTMEMFNVKNISSSSLAGLTADTFVKSDNKSVAKTTTSPFHNIRPISLPFCGARTTESVVNKLNRQLMDVSVNDVEKIVDRYPKNDRELVLKILKRATQFGNMNSLNGLYESIMDKKLDGYHCYSFSTPEVNSLIENLTYLSEKKAFPFDPAVPIELDNVFCKKKGAFLIDDNMLSIIKNDKELIKHISENDFQLFYPEGWDNGITAFNLTTVDEIGEKTNKLFKKVKEIQSIKGLNTDDAISEVLNQHSKDKLAQLGLEDKLVVLKNGRIDFSKEATPQNISKQLESRRMSKNSFEANLPENSYEIDPAFDILENDGILISMRELGLTAKKINSEITKIAERKNIDKSQIFYLIPVKNKSYGVIALQYQQINHVPKKQFILDYEDIPQTNKPKMVVVLDDYAGSGDSLVNVYRFLRHNYTDNLVIAPYVATNKGAKFINQVTDGDEKILLMPGRIINSYFETNDYIKKENKWAYSDLIGKGGWGNTQANIAFPYMSPDNNTSFFANKIAANYTLNSAGVKRSVSGESSYDDFD